MYKSTVLGCEQFTTYGVGGRCGGEWDASRRRGGDAYVMYDNGEEGIVTPRLLEDEER